MVMGISRVFLSLILSSVLTIVLTLFISKFFSKNPFKYLGFVRLKKSSFICFFYFLLILIANYFLSSYLKLDYQMDLKHSNKTLLILGFCVFGPLVEEVLFRGFLFVRMNDLLNKKYQWITLFITSILFASVHLQYDYRQMFVVFCIGLFLAFVRWKTESLWLPILFHVLNNSLAFYLLY